MVETGTIGALDDVILLPGPLELHLSANQVPESADALSGHLQANHRGSAFGFEPGRLLIGFGHPAPAVDKALTLGLGRFALLLQLLLGGEVPIGEPACQ